MDRGLDGFSLGVVTQNDATAVSAMRRQLNVRNDFANVSSDRRRSRPLQNLICNLLERFTSPTDSDANFAGIKHGIVILCVTDADAVMQGEAQCIERLAQASCLINSLRQDHDATVIKLENERQFELPDCFQNLRRRRGIRFDNAFAKADCYFARAKLIEQNLRRRMSEPPHWSFREREHSSVLGDDGIKQFVLWQNALQVRQNPPGHEDDYDSTRLRLFHRLQHERIGATVVRDCAIVVQGHDA